MAECLFPYQFSNIAPKIQKYFIKRSTLVPVWNVTWFEGVQEQF